MSTFIRVAEVWVPDADGYLLEFGGGLYGNAPDFGAVSRSMCFGRGEGLPGRVWEEARPIILKDLQAGFFQRAAAAKAARLSCAMAFPVFYGDLFKAVVVLFCGDDSGTSPTSPPAADSGPLDQGGPAGSGALEIWHNDPRVTSDLRLLDGVYGADDAAFEAASRDTLLPRGSGLPGLAWQRQASVYMDGVADSTAFVRASEAAASGIRQGLAFPCPLPSSENVVLAFLSVPATPVARRIEGWLPDGSGPSLKRAYGFGAPEAAAPESDGVDPTILEAFAGGVPTVKPAVAGQPGAALIAIPVISDGAVVEAIAMYF